MATKSPFENQPPEFEPADASPELQALDASLRRLASQAHPRPEFSARLRGEMQHRMALTPPRRSMLTWTRPLFAQAALVALLVGLVGLALGLAPHLQGRPTLLPGVRRSAATPGPDGSPAGLLAHLGKGAITALDSNSDGLLAVAATGGVCVYEQGVREEWCAWADAGVQSVAFNPGGDLLAVGLGDGRLQIRDARTGQIRAGHAPSSWSSISSLAWDPSGAPVVASVIYGGEITAWNWQEDVLRWGPKKLPSGAQETLAWTLGAGGESVLASGGANGLTLLDGETGIERAHYDPTWQMSPVLGITALGFSSPGTTPDGQPWLAYAYQGGVAALKMSGWQISGTRNWPFGAAANGASNEIQIAFSPPTGADANGPRLAAASRDGVRIFQIEKGTVEQLYTAPIRAGNPAAGNPAAGSPIAWTPAGELFFAVSNGMLGQIPLSGDPLTVVQSEYTTSLFDMAWAGQDIVATNGLDEVRTWRTGGSPAADGNLAGVDLLALGAEPVSFVFSPDGSRLACVLKNGGTLVLWDLTADQPAWTAELYARERHLAFSSDGKKLAVVTEGGRVTAYDVQTGRVTGEVQAAQPGAVLRDIAWAPAAYGYDVVAAAWERDDSGGIDLASLDARLDWATKSLVKNIQPVIELAWGAGRPGQAGLLAAFQNEQAVLWDAASGAERFRIGETPQMASVFFPTLAFSGDGSRLAISSREGIAVWSLPDGRAVQAFSGQERARRLVFSPDGSTLASASQDGAIILWDLTAPLPPEPTPTPLLPTPNVSPTPAPPPGPSEAALARLGYGAITALDSAPDGRLAVGTTAGVCVHNTGMTVDWCRWLGNVNSVVFDPSGQTLAVTVVLPGNQPDNPLMVLDARGGSTLAERTFRSGWFSPGKANLAWDPFGSAKIAVAETGGLLSVWDWQSGQIAWGAIELSGPVDSGQGSISALDWSSGPSGESILAAGSTLGLSLLDGASGELKQRYEPTWEVAPTGNILALAFAPDDGMGGPGRHLAYASADENLLVLEMQGWQATGASNFDILDPRGIQPALTGTYLDWTPATGDLLSMRLALAYASSLWVYEPFKEGLQPQFVTACHTCAMTWSAGGAGLFLQDYSGMLGKYTDGFLAPYPLDYAFSAKALVWPAANDLYSISDRTTNRWDVATQRLGAVSLVSESQPHSLLAVSPDGQRAAYLLPAQNNLLLWSVANNQRLTLIDASPGPTAGLFGAAAYSADGSRLATVSTTGEVVWWHVATGQPIRGASPLEGANQIDALALSPDGEIAAVAWTDAQSPHITLYSFLRGETLAHIPSSNTISALAWSPDGRMVGAAGGLSALVIDAASGEVLHTLGPEIDPDSFGTDHFEPGAFNNLAFSPDGTRLATGGLLVTLWDTADGSLLKTFKGHTGPVNTLAFRPDGGILASASSDGAILLWDLGAGPLPAPEVVPTPTPIP